MSEKKAKKIDYTFVREETGKTSTGGKEIRYVDPDEKQALGALEKRDDFDAKRLRRLLALPDLTRKENSPLKFIIDRILTLPAYHGFDVVSIPETITVKNNFDVFDFPMDHPARNISDTYFVNVNRILRTQMTSMWLYYLGDKEMIKKLETEGEVGLLSYGKVYRKDEIDRNHFPVFHQIDGLYLTKKDTRVITLEDLQEVLAETAKGVFGPDVEMRFLDDDFPYTKPSTQLEVKFGDEWLELLGAGLARNSTLESLGIDPKIYNGWAFGFGVERLAMMKAGVQDIRILWSEDKRVTKQFTSIDSKYVEVSKYPPATRDISFIVSKGVVPNNFYEIARELGGDLIEEVTLIDAYENDEKLGRGKKSYTFRVVYRSFEQTLTGEEIAHLHTKIEEHLRAEMGAVIR